MGYNHTKHEMKKVLRFMLVVAIITIALLSSSCTKSKSCSCTQYDNYGNQWNTIEFNNQTSCSSLESQLEAQYDGYFICHER